MSEAGTGWVRLRRGGFLIRTGRGSVQYGAPPETIKDTMKLEGGVPPTFIIPRNMFDLATGVSVADIEFPIYYHFFLRKSRARVVCTTGQRERIVAVLSEALFGPAELDVTAEFAEGKDTPGFPDLRAEMDHFRRMPLAKSGFLELDDLVEFVHPDGRGVAAFDGCQASFDRLGGVRLSKAGRELAAIPADAILIEARPEEFDYAQDFRPPVFGITTLGAGHGFDPDASTSGLIIWVNRRGIMVDPPVGSAADLHRLGVSPKWIDKVILTHCHADHDAGTLQKLLQEGKVNLYTTPAIYQGFLRKSAALTGLAQEHLQRLVRFFPVSLGRDMMIDQARFRFHYTLHSIPTIAIQVFLRGKSLIYSSDTMNDPQYIRQLHEKGVLSAGRRDFLLAFPWDRDLVFHEAGIPPLHTPLSHLCSLPPETRARTFLVHVDPRLIPPDSGLRIAPTGLRHTIGLVTEPLPHEESISVIDAFTHIDVFDTLPFAKARELLLIARVRTFWAGEALFHEGDPGDTFFVVMTGAVDIILDGRVITTYSVGGFFGEKSLFIAENRTASAVARADARVLCLGREEMLSLLRGTESEKILRQIALFQNVELRRTLACHPVFQGLTATQQTRLHGILRPVPEAFPPGSPIRFDRDGGPCAYLVREGTIEVYEGKSLVATISRGGLAGIRAFFQAPAAPGLAFAARDEVRLYAVSHADLRDYLDRNPGFHIRLFSFSLY